MGQMVRYPDRLAERLAHGISGAINGVAAAAMKDAQVCLRLARVIACGRESLGFPHSYDGDWYLQGLGDRYNC